MKNNAFQQVTACRVCGNTGLELVVDLGTQYLTGVFPRDPNPEQLTKGPLQLVKCHGGDHSCGLLQLRHSYLAEEMYGANYGYRSGLNQSMVNHLKQKVSNILHRVDLQPSDMVIDIGSNDGTTLSAYPANLTLVGIDPVGAKYKQYYPKHVTLIPELFSANAIRSSFPGRRAKIITSFSMFYDLESPVEFAAEVAGLLDSNDGLWIFEQSYMPLMLERMAFDTICHEHIEYYGLKQIAWILDKADLKIVDVEFNDVNGGSFSIVAARNGSKHTPSPNVELALLKEQEMALDTLDTFLAFGRDIEESCTALKQFVANARLSGKRLAALGASTKGNVILQHCGFTANDFEAVGEINPDKFGCVTPGTWIPIKDEAEVLAAGYDYLLVLPWHFRKGFLNNKVYRGQRLVFPLPSLEIVEV